MISDTEKAYAAGIVDGEGYVGILHPLHGYKCIVSISSNDEKLIDWFLIRWPGGYKYAHKGKMSLRVNYQWKIGSRHAGAFLTDILPYLFLKKDRAELLLLYIDEALSTSGVRLTLKQIQRAGELFEACKKANDKKERYGV